MAKTLIQWLIEKIDTKDYRAGKLSGEKHPSITQGLLEELGGRTSLLNQAKELERDSVLGGSGKIRFQWRDMNADIDKIHYSVDIMPELCRREGIEDPRARQIRYIDVLSTWKEKAKDTWLESYYEDEILSLEKGNCSSAIQREMETERLYACLNEIIHLEEPVEKRIFSARVFKNVIIPEENITPSKVFEKKYEGKVNSILVNYSPEYVEGMSADELLKAHGILSYAQTLEWKGPLAYLLDGHIMVDTSLNHYGTIIGAQTLEHAVPKALFGVKKVMLIENKANYEKMSFSESDLYIYCHGFFSPKEIRFLKKINEIADPEVAFYHWGDLDYGGIRIFQYNKKNVFPKLLPYKMSAADYKQAIEAGVGVHIDKKKREKMAQMDAGLLEELKCCILERDMEVEQELLV